MLQRLRLITGLVLFAYVSSHLLNHSLGTLSLGAAEWGRTIFLWFWRSPLITPMLYTSWLGHVALNLLALYRRRHLRLPTWEIVRLVLGLLIPLMLIPHVFGTRVSHEQGGIEDSYARQMLVFWVLNPALGAQQITLLTVAWSHGCLGLYYWLRVTRLRDALLPVFRILAPVIPILAVVGFIDMGHEVQLLAGDPEWLRLTYSQLSPEEARLNEWYRSSAIALYVGAVALVFAARIVRSVWERRGRTISIGYPDGRRLSVAPGTSVLEASRQAGIPHASLCGGRARCSTCRVRIGMGLDQIPPPERAEARLLQQVQAPSNVRLACQLRPVVDLDVFPLFPPDVTFASSMLQPGHSVGREQEIVILFMDLRGFTELSERRLPYDVVFILNQLFATIGEAVDAHGGHLDKFLGDGVMAEFGLETSVEQGCRAALQAAAAMAEGLDTLNAVLTSDLVRPLRIGIGIHVGQVIVGDMGYGAAKSLTAIGDAVNTASRMQELTKSYQCQLVVSEDVVKRAGVDVSGYRREQFAVRGRSLPVNVYALEDARDLTREVEERP
jgi:adenylate cyclase